MTRTNKQFGFILLFVAAMLLRFALGWVNWEANDNHLLASRKMVETRSLTSYKDCGQCYHPKLFHLTAAVIQEVFHLEDTNRQMRSGQLLNVMLSALFLWTLWQFILLQPWRSGIQLLIFALIAFNPKLIGINAQYTNDTFVITFAALAILSAWRLAMSGAKRDAFLLIAACVGAGLSKGSGLPLTVSLIAFLSIYYILRKQPIILRSIGGLVLLFILVVPYGGNYVQNYSDSKQVLGLNGTTSPAPHFIKRTYYDRPGVISIVDSYLTFPYADLLKNPYIHNGHEGYARNRTSVWAQLYGRTYSVRFDHWPMSWASEGAQVLNTTRALLLLGLIPTVLLIYGLLLAGWRVFVQWNAPVKDQEWWAAMLHLLVFCAMMAMLVKLTLGHRDFCTMKAIYIFPGLISYAWLTGMGMERLAKRSEILQMLTAIFLIALVGLSAYEAGNLVVYLLHS